MKTSGQYCFVAAKIIGNLDLLYLCSERAPHAIWTEERLVIILIIYISGL